MSSSTRRDASVASALAAAEASDDILLRVFEPLTLAQRLRLSTVSKRWHRLLLSKLPIPHSAAAHVSDLCARAGSNLRSLDIDEALRCVRLDDLMKVLCNTDAGRQLQRLLMWWGSPEGVGLLRGVGITVAQALQLAAACPHLEELGTTCVIETDGGARAAASALAVLPGRHVLVLTTPRLTAGPAAAAAGAAAGGTGEALVFDGEEQQPGVAPQQQVEGGEEDDRAAWEAVLLSPRLLGLSIHGCRWPRRDGVAGDDGGWFDASLDAVLCALRSGRCCLEHLHVQHDDDDDDEAVHHPQPVPTPEELEECSAELVRAIDAERERMWAAVGHKGAAEERAAGGGGR